MIQSTEALAGEGWYALAKRLGGSQANQQVKDQNANYLAQANGRKDISTGTLFPNQVIWYNTDKLIYAEVEPEPPVDGFVEGWGYPTWREEFEGATLNPARWRVLDETYAGPDWSWTVAENAFIQNNQLVVRLSQRATPKVTGDGKQRWWDGAYVRSDETPDGLVEQYGRWEARVKHGAVAAGTRGVWPAMWLRNSPGLGEIDMIECWGSPVKRTSPVYPAGGSTLTIHESTNGGLGKVSGGAYESNLGLPKPYTTGEDFHLFAMEYTPTEMRFFLDGRLARRITKTDTPWIWGPNFANNPFHVRFTTGIGDPYWSPDPSITDTNTVPPIDFVVDYLRYWPLPEAS